MACKRTVDIIEKDGETINVTLTFWGETEREADDHFEELLATCPWFKAAVDEDRITDETETISSDELPEVDDEEDEEEER